MGWGSNLLNRLLGDRDPFPITEAATPGPAKLPERTGYEYGVPPGGLTEYRQGMGASTQTDRSSMMTELYEAYLSCPWSWASVTAISRTITAGGVVTDWDNDDGEGDQETPDKPAEVLTLERLLAYCNPTEDIRQLLRNVIVDLMVFGDAFIEITWVGNQPVALYNLDCPTTFPLTDEHGQVTGYVQTTEFGQRAQFEPREVVHIALDAPRSGVFGVSPTQAALLPITTWLFAASNGKEIFRKGQPPTIHVDFPAGMSPSEMTKWLNQYAVRNIGPRNLGAPITTKGGGTVNELSQGKVADLQSFLDQKRDEILACYGVPPSKATVIESGNLGGGTGESQDKTFRVNTCQPIAELILEKLNFHIARQGFGVAGWHMKFRDIDMRDSATIEDIRDQRLRNGSWTLNRYRAEIGEPPVDGGDDPTLVDRQNLVLWRDIARMSAANIAAKGAPAVAAGEQPPGGEQMEPEADTPQGEPPEESHQDRYRRRLREALARLPGGVDERGP
ncbi:phage portal protein [Streptantibioticus silvisoli]|uniref:Phage portal protein n=1 Tax=Streptantibioticus silvisoli TaxID=2705255 RepID=A0ABT6W4Q0_9ACTN|nr:phage portal protein [Streptantibioticus silvisoli]MDI5965728.1 phage portal protein [Streptantibioticus silvisoli]